ncbi:MAG: hypothetical protein JW892_15990 [Anaerolineae bacterium]|nr:hypothetical protein [Anaerolineae bacterium]
MSVDDTRETPETVAPETIAPERLSPAGQHAMQGSASEGKAEQAQDSAPVEELTTARDFGRFAHQGYEVAAENNLDREYVESEVPARVVNADGMEHEGRIDTLVDGRHVIDYKTNDMRDWVPTQAYQAGLAHGAQVSGYVNSPDLPSDATGTVIATVPPVSSEARQAYADGLAQYGIGVQFSESEDPDDVAGAVQETLKNTPEDA